MSRLSKHAKGLLITATGVLVITPDGLLIRLIQTDAWTLLFWRGLLSSVGMSLMLLLIFRRRAWTTFRGIGRPGLLIAALFGVGTVAFILSITHTTVANTLFIISTSPLFAAFIAWRLMREPVPPRTWLAILAALAGIAVIVSGGLDRGSIIGNVAALWAALSLAVSFSLIRRHQDRNMVPAMALSGLVTALIAWPLAQPAAVAESNLAFLLIMGLLMLPLSFGLLFIGPRYIPAPEVSLMLLLEAILGPVWVWLVVGENPGLRTVLGGVIVITTLAANSALALMQVRERQG